MRVRYFGFAIVTLISAVALAGPKKKTGLPGFVPGNYVLQQGTEDECGSGAFELRDGGRNIGLGPLHGFDTENKTEKIDADIPELTGCVYNTKNVREIKGEQTILSFEEILNCGLKLRHTLTEVVTLSKEKIHLDVAQKGAAEFGDEEPSFSYTCAWTPEPTKSAGPRKKK